MRGSSVPARTPAAPSRATKSAGSARRSAHTMFVRTCAGSTLPGQRSRERVGEAAGAGVIVGEPLDHRLERDDPGRGDHAGLAHPAAPARPVRARLGDHVGGAAQQRADRRAEPLRQAEHHGVGRRDELARRRAERDRRVPDARAVDVHAQPARARDVAQRRHLGRVDRRARQRHVRVLDHEQRRARQVVRDAFDRGAHAVGQVPQRMHLHAAVAPARPRLRSGTRARGRGTAPRCPASASTRIASWFAIVPDGT